MDYVLRMQELNRADMFNHALNELARTDTFDPDFKFITRDLARDIAGRSHGVWL